MKTAMFCIYCGAEIDDKAEICPKCGLRVAEPPRQTAETDAPNGGFFALGLFFPLVGFILYLVWQNEWPKKAASCGKGALTGAVVYVSLVIVSVIIFVILAVGLAAAAPMVS